MAVGARGLLGLVAASALLTPAAAQAATVIEARTVWRYDMSAYTLAQGDALTFRNVDEASPGPHNVTSQENGPDGKPLFASETVPNGKEVPVTGAQQLQTGSYSFFCTVHPFMTATLAVTGGGTAQPPPSGGDKRAPSLQAALGKTTLGRFLKTRRISARIASDERAALSLRLTATIGSRAYTLATAAAPGVPAGSTKTLVLRSSKSRMRPLRGARRVKLTLAVEGRDDAGNVGTARARRTLSRK